LLTAKRNASAARRFFDKTIQHNEVPDTVTMDKSGANKAVLDLLNTERETPIKIRQVKYLNNIVEQDHRAMKRITRPMLGFKSFRSAQAVLAGIELMHMVRKGQFMMEDCDGMSFADQFYTLAGQVRTE
jgi:transposase-like protein